jgi:hypothetical protein
MKLKKIIKIIILNLNIYSFLELLKINNIIKPDYVIPPGLDSSSHENSIVGEK